MPLRWIGWIWLATLLLTACRSAGPSTIASTPTPPMRLLFVGNSLTYYNGGLENHVRLLAASATPPRILVADRATQGGATLRILHGLPAVHERIQQGHYDQVILQDDLPELTEHSIAPFQEYVRRFDQEIRSHGGRPVLFMAWPYERLGWISLEQIADAHRSLGTELKIPVAPVGLAFRRSLEARPQLAMLGKDREHETLHGTYLAACVHYTTLLGVSPEGLPYRPDGVSADEGTFLQSIAWQTVQAWTR